MLGAALQPAPLAVPCDTRLYPQTLEEIAEMEEDIRRLEEDLRNKAWDLKVAHTRLETRTYRPDVELCRDQVPARSGQQGLGEPTGEGMSELG